METILTKRLILKPLSLSDDESMYMLHADKEVMKYIRPVDQDIFQTKKRIKEILTYSKENPGLGLWNAFNKETDEYIGWGILLHIEHKIENPIEVGFRLHTKFWKQGFGHEIGSALVEYGKNINLDKIVGITRDDNIGSQKTLEKCGLTYIEDRIFYEQQVRYYEVKL